MITYKEFRELFAVDSNLEHLPISLTVETDNPTDFDVVVEPIYEYNGIDRTKADFIEYISEGVGQTWYENYLSELPHWAEPTYYNDFVIQRIKDDFKPTKVSVIIRDKK